MRKFDDIIPPSRRREMEQGNAPAAPSGAARPPRTGSRLPYLTTIVILAIIVISVAALFYFSSAEVIITPNTADAAVQSTFTADRTSGDLPFQVISVQKIASQSVPASGTKTVTTSASGSLTIYNTQAAPEKLIANTRFASPAGLIFRIHSAVTVPAGTASKPGSVTAKIYADQPGASYNIAPASFTVPGLAGTALDGKIYGRSSAAMTGGASGTIPVVDSASEASAVSALITALGPQLSDAIKAQVPPGYVLLPGAATTTYSEEAPAPSATSGSADVKEDGSITAVVFPSAALAAGIALAAPLSGYQNEPLTLSSTDGLALSPVNGIPDASATTFAFSLSGTAHFVYTVDPSRIAAAVAGKSRSAAETALTNYPEVEKAVLILRPFWRNSFPQDPASIQVSVGTPVQ